MKRAFNIFTAFALTVVLAFGFQVTSAFALSPSSFTLEPYGEQPVRTEGTSQFMAFFDNSSGETAMVEVDADSICGGPVEVYLVKQQSYDCEGASIVLFTNQSNASISVNLEAE